MSSGEPPYKENQLDIVQQTNISCNKNNFQAEK